MVNFSQIRPLEHIVLDICINIQRRSCFSMSYLFCKNCSDFNEVPLTSKNGHRWSRIGNLENLHHIIEMMNVKCPHLSQIRHEKCQLRHEASEREVDSCRAQEHKNPKKTSDEGLINACCDSDLHIWNNKSQPDAFTIICGKIKIINQFHGEGSTTAHAALLSIHSLENTTLGRDTIRAWVTVLHPSDAFDQINSVSPEAISI